MACSGHWLGPSLMHFFGGSSPTETANLNSFSDEVRWSWNNSNHRIICSSIYYHIYRPEFIATRKAMTKHFLFLSQLVGCCCKFPSFFFVWNIGLFYNAFSVFNIWHDNYVVQILTIRPYERHIYIYIFRQLYYDCFISLQYAVSTFGFILCYSFHYNSIVFFLFHWKVNTMNAHTFMKMSILLLDVL